ncbi:Fe-S cluster assembly protein SufD [Algisphaera agarilytica]|uniref:Fe-S cluster assembly protein SufD n=1 Tax=Algisphaera agarilytica TaxID=1385975 RepID=A0A7X0H6D0_9BACT|nr:Fe-S cluster assembly protein SufD [Algisphaera agarilytica]MBB6429877.1 Fe-S cluster assembly protein SufD [Algisphaera agarilytica]
MIDVTPNRPIPECQSWLNPLREAGRIAFNKIGWPGRKNESWRFTDLSELKAHNFVSAVEDEVLSLEQAQQFAIPELEDVTLVFVNGRYQAHLSDDPAGLGDGITCCTLRKAACEHRAMLEPYIGQLTRDTDDPFTALSNASIEGGVFVHVPKGQAANKPLHILSIATAGSGGTAEPIATHPRNVVVAEQNAELTVIEHYVTLSDDAVYLNNAITEVFAAERAKVHHYLLEKESESAYNVSSLYAHLEEEADIRSHTVLLGGKLVRNNVLPTLAGKNAHCLINGLYVGHNEQHLDNAMRVHHAAPDCESRQFYKGILNGKSRGVFTGRIIVDQVAQLTDAVQSNRNMLLSEEARVNARPQLEIYADDVQCTHGCTTGAVDPESVFYFMSRGLSEDVSRAMLIYAFAAEGFDRMELVPVRRLLAREMIAKLPKAYDLSIEV